MTASDLLLKPEECMLLLVDFQAGLAFGVERPFEVRMGINTGQASVGNFGSKGRMDYTAPFACAQAYFDKLDAPLKRIIWFAHSAHFPFLEEPQIFAAALDQVAAETKGRSD